MRYFEQNLRVTAGPHAKAGATADTETGGCGRALRFHMSGGTEL